MKTQFWPFYLSSRNSLPIVEGKKKKHIWRPLWSLIHRKFNDSATVALFWHMLPSHSVKVLDRRAVKYHSRENQSLHHSKMSMTMRNCNMNWILCHLVVQRLRRWWVTQQFKGHLWTKGSKDSNITFLQIRKYSYLH